MHAELELVKQLKQAAESTQSWLDGQSGGLVSMAETRRATKHFLLKMEQRTGEMISCGKIGAAEGQVLLEQIRHLQAKNHFSYTSRKFQAAFAGRSKGAEANPLGDPDRTIDMDELDGVGGGSAMGMVGAPDDKDEAPPRPSDNKLVTV